MRTRQTTGRLAALVLVLVSARVAAARAQQQRATTFWNPFAGGWHGNDNAKDGDSRLSSQPQTPPLLPSDDDRRRPPVIVVRPDGSSSRYDAGGAAAGGLATTTTTPATPAFPPPPAPLPPPPPPSPSPSPKPPTRSPASSEAEALLQAATQTVGTTFLSAASLAGGSTAAAQQGAGLAGDALAAALDASAPGGPPGAGLVGFYPVSATSPASGGGPAGAGTRGAPPVLAEAPGGGGGGGYVGGGGGYGGGGNDGGPLVVPASCGDLWDCIQRAPALQLLRRWVEIAQFQDALPKCGGAGGAAVTLAGKPLPGGATLFATADAFFYGFNCAGLDFTPLFPIPFGTEPEGKVYAARNFVLGGLVPGARVGFNYADRDRAKIARTYAGHQISYKITSSGDKLVEWTTGLGVRFQARVLGTVLPFGCGGKVALHVVSKPVAPPSSFETQMAAGGDALGAGAPPDASTLSSLARAVAAEPSTRLYFSQLAATGMLDSLPRCVPGGRVAYNGRVSQGATVFVPRDAFFYGVSCWALNFAPLARLFRDNPAARAFAQANFVASGVVADQALGPSAFTGSPRRASTAGGGQLAVFRDPSTGALKVAWDNARLGAVREARVLRTIIPKGCANTVMHVVDVAVAPKGALAGKRRRRRRTA